MAKLEVGVNDLATVNPELAAQWHPTKNVGLANKYGHDISTPDKLLANSHREVWWIYPYDDPKTGKHFDFEWKARVADRSAGQNCPYLTGHAVWKGFNDLASVNPELAKQWHPTKNGNLTPTEVTAGTAKKVWWCFPYDVPMDYPIEHLRGKHFDFEWEASLSNRSKGDNCPYLPTASVPKTWPGFNDLATTHPYLAKEWHSTKNGDLALEKISYGYDKKVWWHLPYDVPMDYPIEHLRGKHFEFEWESSPNSRTNNNSGCPFLSGSQVWIGFNDLKTTHPELALQWHPTRNGNLKPVDFVSGSTKKVWWYLPYDVPDDYPIKHLRGKHFDFEWESSIRNRTIKNVGCPFLSTPAASIWVGFNDLATTHPELSVEWHPTKNGDLTPEMVSAGSDKKVWWSFSYVDNITGEQHEYEWLAGIGNRARGAGCPFIFSSKGEEAVRKILNSQNIIFKEENTFKDRFYISPNKPLRDDFAIFDKNGKIIATIEFHGQQHYEPVDFGGYGAEWAKDEFKRNQERDKIKTDYLEKHGIRQLIVPYTEFDNVEVIVKDFIVELSKNYELFASKEEKDVAAWVPPSQKANFSKKEVREFMNKLKNEQQQQITSSKNSNLKSHLFARKNLDISI